MEFLVPIKIGLPKLGKPQELSIQTGTLAVKGQRTLDTRCGSTKMRTTSVESPDPYRLHASAAPLGIRNLPPLSIKVKMKTQQATAACKHTHLIVRLPGVLTLSFACCNRARSIWCLALAGTQMPCASLDLLLLCNLSCLKEGA